MRLPEPFSVVCPKDSSAAEPSFLPSFLPFQANSDGSWNLFTAFLPLPSFPIPAFSAASLPPSSIRRLQSDLWCQIRPFKALNKTLMRFKGLFWPQWQLRLLLLGILGL